MSAPCTVPGTVPGVETSEPTLAQGSHSRCGGLTPPHPLTAPQHLTSRSQLWKMTSLLLFAVAFSTVRASPLDPGPPPAPPIQPMSGCEGSPSRAPSGRHDTQGLVNLPHGGFETWTGYQPEALRWEPYLGWCPPRVPAVVVPVPGGAHPRGQGGGQPEQARWEATGPHG